MPSWFHRAHSRSNTEVLDGKSGKSRTTKPDSSKSPDGERPLLKTSTDYGMYHPVAKHGQPELIPVWIKVYNLDWDELLPVLKDAYPNQTFPENKMGVEDHYQIYVPRKLSDKEDKRIELIRKDHRNRVNQSIGRMGKRLEHSPDGPRKQPAGEQGNVGLGNAATGDGC